MDKQSIEIDWEKKTVRILEKDKEDTTPLPDGTTKRISNVAENVYKYLDKGYYGHIKIQDNDLVITIPFVAQHAATKQFFLKSEVCY